MIKLKNDLQYDVSEKKNKILNATILKGQGENIKIHNLVSSWRERKITIMRPTSLKVRLIVK